MSLNRTRMGNESGRGTGFTLVELLVVIGIIALLMSILLPALHRARDSARAVACQTNLRSLGQAIYLYAHNNDGFLPWGAHFAGGADVNTHWVLLLQSTMQGGGASWNDMAGAGNLTRVRDAFMCPEVPGSAKNALISGTTHFMSHPRLMPQFPNSANLTPYRLARVKRSSEIALIFDAPLIFDGDLWRVQWDTPVANHMDRGRLWGWTSPHTNMTDEYVGAGASLDPNSSIDVTPWGGGEANIDSPQNTQTVRFRHSRDTVANVLMVDGHVERFKYTNPTTTTLLRKNINVNR
jgi:prepilin-type N-terminal cleavage/methylation domain-containing protein/prepilin-type processing-associated H-X9-DG protein